jgi:hypothetical protein
LTTALFTSISSTDLARANALRYTLAGIVGAASRSFYFQGADGFVAGAPRRNAFKFNVYAGYFSDQWRLRPNLTLNWGVRYELYTPLTDPNLVNLEPRITNAADPIASLLDENVQIQVLGGNAGKAGQYHKADKNNFGPNVSFAYSPRFDDGVLGSITKDMVIRGGFRVGYNNDEYVRSTDNATLNNAGLGGVTVNARNGNSNALASSLSNIAPFNGAISFATPAVPVFPRSFADNATTFAETISLVDPNLQLQQNLEYNLGVQRNIGFKSVLEVRYVGGLSNQMVRSIDYNQININGSGFFAEYQRARENCRLQGATLAPAGAFDTRTFCTSAAYNAAIPGSQQLPLFTTFNSLLTNSTILGLIRSGAVAELANVYLGNGLLGFH